MIVAVAAVAQATTTPDPKSRVDGVRCIGDIEYSNSDATCIALWLLRLSEAPPSQIVPVTVSSVPGASGVLESEEDVDGYLTALRDALIQTLNDGKWISL